MLRSKRSRYLVLFAVLALGLAIILWNRPTEHAGPGSVALAAPGIEIRPARVKPGDPEIRVPAAPDIAAVRVELPFETEFRLAVLDEETRAWSVRFLVPSDLPEGRYEARVLLEHTDGSTEERRAAIHVDTSPAPVAVLAAPARVEPGRTLALRLKPALPLATLAGAVLRSGGIGEALKGAMDVKEILVRAPWGEVAKARLQGALGAWTAELHVPPWEATGTARLEIVASDAAGNVSRRAHEVEIGPAPLPAWIGATASGLLAALAGGMAMVLRPRTCGDSSR